MERELALLEREPVLPFRTSCRLRGGSTAQEQFDSLFDEDYSYLMGKLLGVGRARAVPNEYDFQDMCNELDKLPRGSGRLNISSELFQFIVHTVVSICQHHASLTYVDKATTGVGRGDFKRYWVSHFAAYSTQVRKLTYGEYGTVRSTEQEHTIRAVWIYLMVIKTLRYEIPLTRANNATLVVRRTSLTR